MPSIAQVPQEGGGGKKRRREDSGEVARVRRYVYCFYTRGEGRRESGKTPRDGKARQDKTTRVDKTLERQGNKTRYKANHKPQSQSKTYLSLRVNIPSIRSQSQPSRSRLPSRRKTTPASRIQRTGTGTEDTTYPLAEGKL